MAYKYSTHKTAEIDAAVDSISAHVQNDAVHISAAEKQKLAGLENYDDTELRGLIGAKQDMLVAGTNLDSVPTENSTNPVTSGGVFTALAGKAAIQDIFSVGTAIRSNTDLDTVTTPGVYACTTSTIAGTLTNAPTTTSAFRLEVMHLNNNTRIRQVLYPLRADSAYYARSYTSAGWQPWYIFEGAVVS